MSRNPCAQPFSASRAFVEPGPSLNSAANDLQAALSDDAETLFFSSNRPGGAGSDDLWIARREPLFDG